MATDLVAVEEELIARLAAVGIANGVSISKLDAFKLKEPVQSGQVFVVYNGLKASDVLTFNAIQTTTFRYQIWVRYVNLATHDQAYPLLGAIKDRLRDFKPLGRLCTKPMRFVQEKPDLSQVSDYGIWAYIQDYEFDLLEV